MNFDYRTDVLLGDALERDLKELTLTWKRQASSKNRFEKKTAAEEHCNVKGFQRQL